jgi:hypothetical protein
MTDERLSIASLALAMAGDVGHTQVFPQGNCLRVVARIIRPRNQRAQGMPGDQLTRSLACKSKKHASKSPQVRRNIPAFPARMVLTASFVLAPETGFLASVV